MSFVSIYNQIMDNRDIRGIDAIIPPKNVLFFDISDIATIINDEVIIFINK